MAPASRVAVVALSLQSVLSPAMLQADTIFYVDAAADGANNGSSWADAFTDLQAAVAASTANATCEIWVAAGTYRPSKLTDAHDPRSATFQLCSEVAIYGGFLGGEGQLEARNPDANVVVLSGDLAGNDSPEPDPFDTTRFDNTYNVVTCIGEDRTAILDGVTVSGGHASLLTGDQPEGISPLNSGAGMFIQSASPTIRYCTFRGNSTRSCHPTQGGGMLCIGSNPLLENCIFENNKAYGEATFSSGGGICAIDSNLTLIDCEFTSNTANGYDSEHWGGAVDIQDSNATLTRCVFVDNLSHFGGAVFTIGIGSATLTDCLFLANWAHNAGGGMSIGFDAYATLTSCWFSENSAAFGGGVHSVATDSAFAECSFIWNGADEGGGMMTQGSPTLTDCYFGVNTAGRGGGIQVAYEGSPHLLQCRFDANIARCGGAVYIEPGSAPVLTNCTLVGNSAWSDWRTEGGGGAFSDAAAPVFIGCLFNGNSTAGHGGGIRNYSWGPQPCQATLTNCTFTGNTANQGNTLACGSDERAFPGTTTIRNCILWDGVNGLANDDGSTITAAYSDIQGGWPGEGNIDADPILIDPDGADNIIGTDDDRPHLSAVSPCIDAGNNSLVPVELTADLDDRPRFVDILDVPDSGIGTPPIVDMGACERIATVRPDLDADGDVDSNDFDIFRPCVTGPAIQPAMPACRPSDFDGDEDVDQSDFGIFQRCYGGTDVRADPNCGK